MLRRRRAWSIAVLLATAGCATTTGSGPGPPTGAMWAFFTDSDVVLGPRAVIYMTSQVGCETERRRRLGATSACVAVVVSPGPGYYAIELPANRDAALPGGASFGTLDRDRCERLRTDLFRAFNAMGDCQPVSVKRTP